MKKHEKKLIILPIFFVSLATLLVMAHVFALPKKVLAQFTNVNNFKKIINIGKEENADDTDDKNKIIEDKKQVIDGQEKFAIAAEGDSCHPDHYNYTPFYEINSVNRAIGPDCFVLPESFHELVEQALANDTDGDNGLHIHWSSFPGVHSLCSGNFFASQAPREYRVFVPPGTTAMNLDIAWTTGFPRPVYATHFKTPPQGDYSGIDYVSDINWSDPDLCRTFLDGSYDPNVLESEQSRPIPGYNECVFEEEDIFTYKINEMIVPIAHSYYNGGDVQEGGWMYLKLLNDSSLNRGAYVYNLYQSLTVVKDVFLDWYNNATFDVDGNPLCSGYSGPSGNSGSTDYSSPSDFEFEGMGLVDPYRGNGMDISSYINDDNELMVNADYQNLIRISAPGKPSIIFDKGVKVSDGDVYAADYHGLIFQGHTLEWSMPIRGNHILYYR